jgi:cell division protein ZipA
MTLSIWFLVFGGLSVIAIVIDGVRRMFASHAALKIDIDESLCDLVVDQYGSELPNGGARVVVATAQTTAVKADAVEPMDTELFPMQSISTTEVEIDSALNLDFAVEDEPESLTDSLDSLDADDSLDVAMETYEAAELDHTLAAADATPEIDEILEVDETPLVDEFSLTPVAISLSGSEASEQTTPEAASPSVTFDPTRPVHELVESQAMVQNELFAEQDLAELPKLKSHVTHALIESSDDILFSDTGIESSGDDFALSDAESLAQHSQDESLSSKLAKVTSMNFGKKLLNRKRAAEQAASEQMAAQQQAQSLPAVEHVISILVSANDSQGFYGPALRKLVEACGLVYGEMNIFHRFEDVLKLGKNQFSMANMMEPGTFDLETMDQLHTPGVVFFLGLPTAQDSMQAFDFMLETAQCLASNLGGEVLDEQRSVMRPQTIEHCRQQIRDFERRSMTRRAQL